MDIAMKEGIILNNNNCHILSFLKVIRTEDCLSRHNDYM